MVLFLATIGSYYTGYSIIDQSQITLKQYPFPFVKNNVPNDVYVVMPYDYTYNEYKAATEIAETIKGNNLVAPKIVTTNEVPEGKHNLVLIGTPCTNELVSEALATLDCNSGLEPGQGLLRLINYDRTSTLVVSGYSSSDLEKAAIVISNYNFYPLMKNSIVVYGEVGNLFLNYH